MENNNLISTLRANLGMTADGIKVAGAVETDKISAISSEYAYDLHSDDINYKIAMALAVNTQEDFEKTAGFEDISLGIDSLKFKQSILNRFDKIAGLEEREVYSAEQSKAIKIAYLSVADALDRTTTKEACASLLYMDKCYLNSEVLGYDFFTSTEKTEKVAENEDPASLFATSLLKKSVTDSIRQSMGDEMLNSLIANPEEEYNALPLPVKQQLDQIISSSKDAPTSADSPQGQEQLAGAGDLKQKADKIINDAKNEGKEEENGEEESGKKDDEAGSIDGTDKSTTENEITTSKPIGNPNKKSIIDDGSGDDGSQQQVAEGNQSPPAPEATQPPPVQQQEGAVPEQVEGEATQQPPAQDAQVPQDPKKDLENMSIFNIMKRQAAQNQQDASGEAQQQQAVQQLGLGDGQATPPDNTGSAGATPPAPADAGSQQPPAEASAQQPPTGQEQQQPDAQQVPQDGSQQAAPDQGQVAVTGQPAIMQALGMDESGGSVPMPEQGQGQEQTGISPEEIQQVNQAAQSGDPNAMAILQALGMQ